ncbi:DUF3267 domain-containing protein [Pollutibacter soli]|uniref:DUF3267 domain-containing protein n=1 Tax=Pollutibacter soli TaxID=3034157 RepID=UPI00301402BC
MKIGTEELTAHGYEELETLNHKELVPFIQKYLKKRTAYSVFYYAANFLLFAVAGYMLLKDVHIPDYDFGTRFAHLAYGIALALALLPLHEYIHVLAYKALGAKNTSYDVNLKKFYVMAIADRFVADRREFTIVALAPFAFITTLLILICLFVNAPWKITVTGVLLMHTAMCSGDFGLLSFFSFHKDKDVVTYDEKERGLSFFYGKAR